MLSNRHTDTHTHTHTHRPNYRNPPAHARRGLIRRMPHLPPLRINPGYAPERCTSWRGNCLHWLPSASCASHVVHTTSNSGKAAAAIRGATWRITNSEPFCRWYQKILSSGLSTSTTAPAADTQMPRSSWSKHVEISSTRI